MRGKPAVELDLTDLDEAALIRTLEHEDVPDHLDEEEYFLCDFLIPSEADVGEIDDDDDDDEENDGNDDEKIDSNDDDDDDWESRYHFRTQDHPIDVGAGEKDSDEDDGEEDSDEDGERRHGLGTKEKPFMLDSVDDDGDRRPSLGTKEKPFVLDDDDD
jgi:hypothetical protein